MYESPVSSIHGIQAIKSMRHIEKEMLISEYSFWNIAFVMQIWK